MVPINENKDLRWYAQRHFPSFLLIDFQNMLNRQHQIGSNFCYITWNKRLEEAYIFSKHLYSIALPPFWMTDKGDKCEYNALLNRWKAKLKSEQKVQINPGSATTSCNHWNKGNNDRCRFLEFVIKIKRGGGGGGGIGRFSHRAGHKRLLCPLRISPETLQH